MNMDTTDRGFSRPPPPNPPPLGRLSTRVLYSLGLGSLLWLVWGTAVYALRDGYFWSLPPSPGWYAFIFVAQCLAASFIVSLWERGRRGAACLVAVLSVVLALLALKGFQTIADDFE